MGESRKDVREASGLQRVPVYWMTKPLLLSEASLRNARKSVLELLSIRSGIWEPKKLPTSELRESGPS